MENTIDRLFRYVKIETTSSEESGTHPSSAKEFDLARLLLQELKDMGADDVYLDEEHCYVYATVPASEGYEDKPVLGFIAHMDTSPAMSGKDVNPRIIDSYDGKDIVLNKDLNVIMKVEDFPFLESYKGDSLIVTDGTTLLGADDKAGVAEIMTLVEYLLNNTDKKHGKIRIAFTPDEEIGEGPDFFDVALFGADFAYTVDGGTLGELEYENFNAAGAKVVFNGRNVHPGSAKGIMKNSILISSEFQSLLPAFQNPMYTEKYEGFFHLDSIKGNVEQTVCDYIIRDHDRDLFEEKKKVFLKCADFINEKYGEGTCVVDLRDQYKNMKEIMKDHMHLIENARASMEELGVEPKISPIRGGTDGAQLSFMGLPCPNLCTGGENFHGKYEFASVSGILKTVEILKRIVEKYS
ncbi:MAG: peptidase T [Acetatifactor sp.]|nr:peptidase T [Acetatifactor sp.]